MAVPGRVDWKSAEGCNHLIREGARLVTGVDDVIEELTPLCEPKEKRASRQGKSAPQKKRDVRDAAQSASPTMPVSLEESLVLRSIPENGATIDAIGREAKLPAAKVNSLLVGLRLKGRVRFLPGNRVALA